LLLTVQPGLVDIILGAMHTKLSSRPEAVAAVLKADAPSARRLEESLVLLTLINRYE
jgi:hypothetical protein